MEGEGERGHTVFRGVEVTVVLKSGLPLLV